MDQPVLPQRIDFANQSDPSQYYEFGVCLVIGLGASAATLLHLLRSRSTKLLVYSRKSANGLQIHDELLETTGSIINRGLIVGETKLDCFCLDLASLRGPKSTVDNIFLCTQNDDYAAIVGELSKNGILKPGQNIIGISARLGSSLEITKVLTELGHDPKKFTLASFSVYYAATKCHRDKRTEFETRALKAEVKVGFSQGNPQLATNLKNMLGALGIRLAIADDPLEAEMRNNNLYGHAQLTVQNRILHDIFDERSDRLYLFRLEPEGCLSRETALQMSKSEAEISEILRTIHLDPPNIMQMFLSDMYPIPGFLTTIETESFPLMRTEEKADILFQYFLALQKNPITGKPQLEAVKLVKAVLENGIYIVPRIPGEDYSGIVLLTELAALNKVQARTLNDMRSCFENFCDSVAHPHNIKMESVQRNMKDLASIIQQYQTNKEALREKCG